MKHEAVSLSSIMVCREVKMAFRTIFLWKEIGRNIEIMTVPMRCLCLGRTGD